MKDRATEVRKLMAMPLEQVLAKAGDHLTVCKSLKILYKHFADEIATEIKINNSQDKPTRLILPIGPHEQYPYLVKILNENKISLKNCWFFFMDEYCDSNGNALNPNHPLSFKSIGYMEFINKLDKDLGLKTERVIFPDKNNIELIDKMIEEIGGIDTCYGGVGIHGHVAFNEPEPEVSIKGSRKVKLNDFTITINAIRANIGGNVENFPKQAYTIGMKQILNSKHIHIYCRSNGPYNWAACVLRIALLGEIGDDYPVTHIRNHPDYMIITDFDTLDVENIITKI